MMKNNTRTFFAPGLFAFVIIGASISEIQLMQPGDGGSTTVGYVKNCKTRTALDCIRTINSFLDSPRTWRLC